MDRTTGFGCPGRLHGPDEPVYTISVAARLLKVTPQVLRQLEREGILEPARTDANARLYSENELMLLKHVCSLIRDHGINIAGVKHILELERAQGAGPFGGDTGRYRDEEGCDDDFDGDRAVPVGGPARK